MGGYDLHVHTHYSYDAFQSPERVVAVANRRGLDGVAITDHDAFEGARVAERVGEEVQVIKGMEIRTRDYDDLLALFIDEPISARWFSDAVAEIHDQGGLAVLPHPYRKFDEIPEEILELVDAIEGLNARSKSRWNDGAAELAAKRDLVATAGSDAHTSFEVGKARTHVLQSDGDIAASELKRAIVAGEIEVRGDESPYYPTHGASVAMEFLKSHVGMR